MADHAFQIVGQAVEAHLRSDLVEGSGLEAGRCHPGLDRAEGVLDGGSANAHGVGPLVQPLLQWRRSPPHAPSA
jgi:hypothetical protein